MAYLIQQNAQVMTIVVHIRVAVLCKLPVSCFYVLLCDVIINLHFQVGDTYSDLKPSVAL